MWNGTAPTLKSKPTAMSRMPGTSSPPRPATGDEIAAAMAFPDGYIPDTLTKKDRVKLAGNAVTPPVSTWICGRVLQALEAA